ncbi:tRNA threonylcarbamoyladenosine biosynthesis protein RimN [Marinomonas sp. M1K-6]|uniref:Threonylcarbamoyl-AMP synthase n=1 Tax=Marinomonas profundi TaxID=2726122 RepID=A0A847QXX3_9GAMM|nr:Sua5/YciO/YrdC/YwlC family protein [Marinomonas profundi]NLQ17499.1 tRNA threonylcarbamoyladenosine biosynthesis protein RimN [Marinomonas profundi]UDV02020.1 Sua5/YciO/YrdC/YwlC family protein [Marinomonas profundi]
MHLITSAIELANIIRQGGVIAYPTEAVWGLGCDPFNESAVRRILALKSRAESKGLILIAGAQDQLTPWRKTLDAHAAQRLISVRETPTSWVVPDTQITPSWVRGEHQSVAIRLSQHQAVQALCAAFEGVIVSTSANPAGLEPAMSAEEVNAYFGDKIDAIFHAPLGKAAKPSQVRDILTEQLFRA